jgi:hypothetical protein
MDDVLVPLNSIASLVPKSEFDDAWQLVSTLIALEQFTRAFRIAVDLFNFSALQLQRAREDRYSESTASGFYDYEAWKEKSQRFSGWQHIAARDGALQIYHIGILVEEKIKGQLNNVPTIRRLVNSSQLRTAVKLFQSYFPNYRLIRHAVAHSHNELAPSANAFRSHAPDEIDVPGLVKGRGIFITNSLYGNTYILSKDKTVAFYEISEPTYTKLESVRMRYIAGFDNARAEVVKGWPKPPSWRGSNSTALP